MGCVQSYFKKALLGGPGEPSCPAGVTTRELNTPSQEAHNAGLSPSSTQGSEKVPLDENETQAEDMKEELQTADIEDGFTNIDTNGLKPVEEEADEVKEDTDVADKAKEGSKLALGTAVAVAGAATVVGAVTACKLSVDEQEEGLEKSPSTVGTQQTSEEVPDDSPDVKEGEDQVINETESLVEVAPSPVLDGTSVITDEIHGLSRNTSVTSGEPIPMGAEEPLSDVSIVESSDPEGSVSGAKEGIMISPETAIGQESGQPISVTNSISEVETSVKEYSLSESNEMQSSSRPISTANSVPTPDDSVKDVGETQLDFQKSTSRPTSSVGLILETEDIEPAEREISIESVSNTVTPVPTEPDKDSRSSRPSSVANSEMEQKLNLSFVEDKLTPNKLEEDSSRPISVSNSLIEDDEVLNNSKKEINAVLSLVEEDSSRPISVTNSLVYHNETAKNVEEEVDVSLPSSEKDLSRPTSASVSLKTEMYVNKDEEPLESNPVLIRPLSVTKSIINESVEEKSSIEPREESIPSRPTSVSNILADTDSLVKDLKEEIPFIKRTDEAILSEMESSVIYLEENTSPVEPTEIKDSHRPTSVTNIANDEKYRDENELLPQLIENLEEDMSKHVNSGVISPLGPKKEVNNEITSPIITPKSELVPENDEIRSTSETKSEIQEVQKKEIRPLSASGNNTEQDIQSIDTKTGSPNKLDKESGNIPTSALEPDETSDELPLPPNESELKEDLQGVNTDLGHIDKSPLDITEEIIADKINEDVSQLPRAPESILTLPESIGDLDMSSEYNNDVSVDINITEGVNDTVEKEEDNPDISITESNKGVSDSTIISTDFNDVAENKLDEEIKRSEKDIFNEQETISTQDKFSEMFGGPIPTINLIESEDIKLSDSDEERETNEYVVVSQYEDEVSKIESTDLSSPDQFNELKENEDVEKAQKNYSINEDGVENLSRADSTIIRHLGNANESSSGNQFTQEKEEEPEVNEDDKSIIEENFAKLTNDDIVLVESLSEQSFMKKNNSKVEVDNPIERSVFDDNAQVEGSDEEGVKTIEESLNESNEISQWTLNLTDTPTSSTFEDHGEKEAGEPQMMEEAGTESVKVSLKDSDIFNLPLTTRQEDVTQVDIRPDTSLSSTESREDSVLAEKGSDVDSLTSIYTMKENDGFSSKIEDRAESGISICKSEGNQNNTEVQEKSESNETEKTVLPETLNKDNLEEEGSVLSSKSEQEGDQDTDLLNSAATTIQASFRGFQTRQGLHKDTITAKVPDAVPSHEIDTVIQDSMFGASMPEVSPSPDNQASIDIRPGTAPFPLISVASPKAAQISSSIEIAGEDPDKDQGIDDVDLVNLQKPQECDELPEDRGEGLVKEDEDEASSSADAESSLSSAATKIQAGVRGYLTRRQIHNLRDDTNATSFNTQPSIPDSQQSFGGLSTSLEENGVHTSGSLETEVQKQQQTTLEEIEDSVIAGEGLLTEATRCLKDIGDEDAKEVTKILSLDSHLDSLPLVEKVEVKSTASLQEPPVGMDSEEDQKVWETLQQELSEAATRIQSNYRGYRTRQKLTREDAVQLPTTSNSAASSSEGDRKTPAQELRNTGEFHDMMVLPTEDITEMTNDSSMYRKMKA